MTENRKELLLRMYDQMFNDIDRHILVVWQSIGVLIGAFAVFALTEKEIITIDIATSLVLLLCGWLIAHLYDAGYWYNRNLVIIANIERQFLGEEDLKAIQYYFGEHRPENRMLTHLKIQYALGVGVGTLLILFHFISRVLPRLSWDVSAAELPLTLPYLTVIAVVWYLTRLARQRDASYEEFLQNSPGIDVKTGGIHYGVGHGFREGETSSSKAKGQ